MPIGACKTRKDSSAIIEEISLAALQVLCAVSTITTLPVLFTEFKIVCLSSGTNVFTSIISALIPSFSRSSIIDNEVITVPAMATIVISSPFFRISALPICIF